MDGRSKCGGGSNKQNGFLEVAAQCNEGQYWRRIGGERVYKSLGFQRLQCYAQ